MSTATIPVTLPPAALRIVLAAQVTELWPDGAGGTVVTRTQNALLRAGITTIRELAASTPEDLLDIRWFGTGQLDEVRRVLGEAGLALEKAQR